MKRRAFKLLVFLLAGAIINVAVAWGLAYMETPTWAHEAFRATQTEEIGNGRWRFILFELPGRSYLFSGLSFQDDLDGMGHAKLKFYADETVVPFWSRCRQESRKLRQRNELGPAQLQIWHERANGLPFRSIYLGVEKSSDPDFVLGTKSSQSLKARLPLLPIWPGFAINTIFYAAIVYALFAVPGAVQRRLRHKRGQCAACGYSLRENVSEKCPECGASA